MTNMVNKNIIGFELVKNVTKCGGYERCGYDKLFVVRKNSDGDYLNALVEVRENTDENRRAIEQKYGIQQYHICNDDYIVWGGCIVPLPDGSDKICFYWS